MRGISEERLREVRDYYHSLGFNPQIDINELIAECKELNPWLPIDENTPKEGTFLVYMPEEKRKFQIAYFHKNVDIIGNSFAFDLTKPTHYQELPAEPKE